MHIDKKLQEIRKILGISRKEFSRLSGLSQTTIYYFEKKNRVPSQKSLRRIIETFHLDEQKFLQDIEFPQRHRSRKINVDEKWLRHYYLERGYTATMLAQQLGVSKSTILARLREYNVPRRPQFGHAGPQQPTSHPEVVTFFQNNGNSITDFSSLLSAVEVKVLHQRLGISGINQRTLEEIGRELNLTRERVRQIQNGALRKLSRELKAQQLIEKISLSR